MCKGGHLGDWYVSPHLLPHYVLDKLVLLEIAYHTYVIGFEAEMVTKRKNSCCSFPLQVFSYNI